MRKRNVHSSSNDDEQGISISTNAILQQVRALDVIYPKAEEEALTRTQRGGAISMTVMLLSLLLFCSEFYTYWHIRYVHSIAVDTRPSSRVPIVFNITFPRLQCSLTAIDVMDVSGEVQVDAAKNVWRTRLTKEGASIGLPYEDLHNEHGEHRVDRRGEGCHVSAALTVNKVAGNVHIALGSMHAHKEQTAAGILPSGGGGSGAKHMHSFQRPEIAGYDASHHIHTFAFGSHIPSIENPLDATEGMIEAPSTAAHFQYFIKIVPTIFTTSSNVSIHTAQYSVTSQTHLIAPFDMGQDSRRVPGIFFIYDLSPFMVQVTEKRVSFGSFLVSVCAIIGGVVTVAGIFSSVLNHCCSSCNSS